MLCRSRKKCHALPLQEYLLRRIQAARGVALFKALRAAAQKRLCLPAAHGVQISRGGHCEQLPLRRFAIQRIDGGKQPRRNAERARHIGKRLPASDAPDCGTPKRKFHAPIYALPS